MSKDDYYDQEEAEMELVCNGYEKKIKNLKAQLAHKDRVIEITIDRLALFECPSGIYNTPPYEECEWCSINFEKSKTCWRRWAEQKAEEGTP